MYASVNVVQMVVTKRLVIVGLAGFKSRANAFLLA